MIGVQIVLLKVALDNRPSPGAKSGIEHAPFSNLDEGGFSRPYEFWQWKNAKPCVSLMAVADPAHDNSTNSRYVLRYWMFLAYFFGALFFIQVFLPPISATETYTNLIGYVGLAVEATLPLPQIIANHRSRSCKGFRLSVIAAWILGDTMKMSYFLFSGQVVPWAFRVCAMFQCVCDFYLGFQYWMYTRTPSRVAGSPRDSENWGTDEKDIRMT